MTIRRAARGLFALAIFLVATLVAAPSGHAQGSGPVTLTLVSQTPWNTLKDPVLELAVRADNAESRADRRSHARRHDRRRPSGRGPRTRRRSPKDPTFRSSPSRSPRRTRSNPPERVASACRSTSRRSAASVGPTRSSTRCGSISGAPASQVAVLDTPVDLPGAQPRGPAPALDDDRAHRAARVRSRRAPRRHRVRGVDRPDRLPRARRWRRSTGWRAARRSAPIDLVDPAVAARPAGTDGRRL